MQGGPEGRPFALWEKFITFESMKNLVAILAMFVAAFMPIFIASTIDVDNIEQEPEVKVIMRKARIVAAGDLMQHMEQVIAARGKDSTYNYTPSFRFVADRFRNADLSIVNLETTLADNGPYSGYPTFRSPTAVADAMQQMGIDLAALANNHCCDRSASGIRSTAKILDQRGIARIGAYPDSLDYKLNNIQYLYGGDMQFAIVNYTYSTNGIPVPKGMVVNMIDTLQMARDLRSIDREQVDCIIAIMHWGNEYERNQNREQMALADFLKRHGVEIIIGSHPHVVQPVEFDKQKGITLYSLGNFVSNQRTRYRDGGLIATIDIEIVDSIYLNQNISSHKSFDLHLDPVWVHLPDYAIIPREVGDTMSMSADSRMRYNRFMSDVSEHLNLQ